MGQTLSPEAWDRYLGLPGTTWRLFTCGDCHPDCHDEDSGEEKYGEPYRLVVAVPDDLPLEGLPEHGVDYCPRCGSYLGMSGDRNVRVTTGGAEKARYRPET